MNKLISFITMLILPIALLSACEDSGLNIDCPAGFTGPSCSVRVSDGADAGNGSTQETTTQEGGTEVSDRPYDLPEGWGWLDDKGGMAAKTPLPEKEYAIAEGKIELTSPTLSGNSDPEAEAKAIYEGALSTYQKGGAKLAPLLQEKNIDGEKTFFVLMEGGAMGDPYYLTFFTFSSNGKVYDVLFYDDIRDYPNVLDTVVKTWRW